MADVNAKDLTTKTSPASTDSMLLFGTSTNEGAKITVDNLADNILGRLTTKTFTNQVGGSSAATILAQLSTLNTGLTNYRSNKVGASNLTNAWYNGTLKSEIAAGNFSNVKPGDYIVGTDSGSSYIVVGFDSYYETGANGSHFMKHHLVMMAARTNTDMANISNKMNTSATTSGGYVGSAMFTTWLPDYVEDYLTPDFGENLLTFPLRLSNATSSGKSSNNAWQNVQAAIPCEKEVVGCLVFGNEQDMGNSVNQFPLFKQYTINNMYPNTTIQLRDIANGSNYSLLSGNGYVANLSAANISNVKPVFCIGVN